MRKTFISLSFVVMCAACGSDAPEIGSGKKFSSLSKIPTASELYLAIARETQNTEEVKRLRASPFAQLGGTREVKGTCPKGGQIVQKSTASGITFSGTGISSGSATITATFDACKIAMRLNGDTFQESLTGSASATLVVEEGTAHTSGSLGITISGDLGFSMQWDFSGDEDVSQILNFSTEPAVSNATGECVFRDGEKEIASPSSEISALHEPMVQL